LDARSLSPVFGGPWRERMGANYMRYEPNEPVDARKWLALDEGERQHIVERYHKHSGDVLPSPRMHCIVHTAIETQIAEGHPAAVRTLARMLSEGLDRHNAVHAVGSVFATHLLAVMKSQRPFDDRAYTVDLDALSAERWSAESKADDQQS
jgi:hypothetical protein